MDAQLGMEADQKRKDDGLCARPAFDGGHLVEPELSAGLPAAAPVSLPLAGLVDASAASEASSLPATRSIPSRAS